MPAAQLVHLLLRALFSGETLMVRSLQAFYFHIALYLIYDYLQFIDAVQYCKEYCLPMAHSNIAGLFNLDHYVKVCLEKTANIH